MNRLNLKIPPPLLVLVFGLLMWLLSLFLPGVDIPVKIRTVVALIIVGTGLAFTIPGILAFKTKGTTVNPLSPEKASCLVQDGIYGVTRNPMYVGLFIYLVAWAIFLSNLYTLPLVICFIFYMNKFQIELEEKALLSLFGEEFVSYKNSVRRWL